MIAAAMCAAMQVMAAGVPSDTDVRAVGKYVGELTRADLTQLRQKKITKEQYADSLVGYATDEKKPAAKFVFFREAFKAYVEAKSWEKADGTYGAAQAEGGTEYALAIVGRTIIPVAAKELKARIEADRKSYRQIGILKNQLKKTPDDESLCESLGLEYAAVGNWDGALAAFLTAPGEVAKVADWELNKGNAYTAAKTAEFWWSYADGKPKAKMEAVRLHAAMWYELALGENAYSGNEAKIVQGRIAETKSYGGAAMQDKATLVKQVKDLKPIVLPLKGKTLIEFVGVPAGEFMMGTDMDKLDRFKDAPPSLMKKHKVTITRPFWLSKYKVTKEMWNAYGKKVELKDYEKAMGGMRVPQRSISYVDVMEFCEWMTKQIRNSLPKGYVVRLPTEAEWEYALFIKDMDSDGLYHNTGANLPQISFSEKEVRKLAASRNVDFGDSEVIHYGVGVEVGMKKPNGMGLFDMLGNGHEMTLDTFDRNLIDDDGSILSPKNVEQKAIVYHDVEIDPLQYCTNTKGAPNFILRGSYWNSWDAHPYAKRGMTLEFRWNRNTFRLCIGPNLMKEKKYSFKPGKKK